MNDPPNDTMSIYYVPKQSIKLVRAVRKIFVSIFLRNKFSWKIMYADCGKARKLNAQNVCCRQTFVNLIFVVNWPAHKDILSTNIFKLRHSYNEQTKTITCKLSAFSHQLQLRLSTSTAPWAWMARCQIVRAVKAVRQTSKWLPSMIWPLELSKTMLHIMPRSLPLLEQSRDILPYKQHCTHEVANTLKITCEFYTYTQ